MKQCKLRSGTTETVAWLDKDVAVGNRVTLKDYGDRLWEVIEVGQHDKDKKDFDAHRKTRLASIQG